MGHVYADARVFARRSVTTRFLVDTGATYTIVPPQLAREVGATVLPRRFRVALADGTERSLQACTMGVELCGRTAPMTALHSSTPIVQAWRRSEEQTSELQSPVHLVCRLLLGK